MTLSGVHPYFDISCLWWSVKDVGETIGITKSGRHVLFFAERNEREGEIVLSLFRRSNLF